MEKINIFISYSHKDNDHFEFLYQSLNKVSEIEVTADPKFSIGANLSDKIRKSIKDATHFIVVLTPHSQASGWVREEIGAAKFKGLPVWAWVPRDFPNIDPYFKSHIYTHTIDRILEQIKLESGISDFKTTDSYGDCAAIFGGANIEYNYEIEGGLRVGRKHIARVEETIGGGGLNVYYRLLKQEDNVLPFLNLGKDNVGELIKKYIIDNSHIEKHDKLINDIYLIPGMNTTRSAIAIDQNLDRTVFSHVNPSGKIISDFIMERIEKSDLSEVGRVFIGHIYEDKENRGFLTKALIDKFSDNSLVFFSPGFSQISLGLEFWKDYLYKIDLLQLNLYEALQFFEIRDSQNRILKLLDKLNNLNINCVITLDKMGSYSAIKDSDDFIKADIFYHPKTLDSTGSGDAFSAGILNSLKGINEINANTLKRAIDNGRIWAAYAATTLGGCNGAPDIKEMELFQGNIDNEEFTELELAKITDKAQRILIRNKEIAYFK